VPRPWGPPEFASILSFQAQPGLQPLRPWSQVTTGDWTRPTLPSGIDSSLEASAAPGSRAGLGGADGRAAGTPRNPDPLLLMDWAFRNGLCSSVVSAAGQNQRPRPPFSSTMLIGYVPNRPDCSTVTANSADSLLQGSPNRLVVFQVNEEQVFRPISAWTGVTQSGHVFQLPNGRRQRRASSRGAGVCSPAARRRGLQWVAFWRGPARMAGAR